MIEILLLGKKKEPFFKRERYLIEVDHGGKPFPSRNDVLNEFRKKYKEIEKAIGITTSSFKTYFGSCKFKIGFFVYSDLDTLKRLTKTKRKIVFPSLEEDK